MNAPQSTKDAVLIDQETGQTFPLDQETITIGRKAGNTIVLANDAAVSRRHAMITRQAGRYLVQDAGSANGTYLNNKRLTEPQPLNHGDVLRLGQTRLTVQAPEEAGAEININQPPPDMTIVGVAPPVSAVRTRSNTTIIPEPPTTTLTPPQAEPPIYRQLFLVQESADLKGNFNIFDAGSGQLLFKCMKAQDLVQSLLKTGGNRFDYWLRTPDDQPILRITRGLAMLGTKPIQVRDERDQLMGEIRPPGRSQDFLFEVFDSVQELLFNVEQIPNGFRFTTSGLECASMSRGKTGLLPKVRTSGDYTVVEVSSAVPTHLFIRQMILATAMAVLLATMSS